MLKILSVKTEYRVNPMGIETQKPRFCWQYADENGLMQTSYRVLVASEPDKLQPGIANKWDSGRILGNCSINVEYEGSELKSCELCYIRVIAETTLGTIESEVFTFEMGLFEQDWQISWRTCPLTASGAAKIFRRNFMLPTGKIRRARAYVCGLGYHECYINGNKVGTGVLNPAVTDCEKTVLYNVYDVTDYLEEKNAIGILAGNGWYGEPRIAAELYVLFDDGREVRVSTRPYERSWLTRSSPIVSNTLFDGEIYDARIEETLTGWNLYSKDFRLGNGWYYAVPRSHDPRVRLRAQQIEEIRVQGRVDAVSSHHQGETIVYDFGRILTGWEVLRVSGERGAKVKIRFAEQLTKEGTLDRSSLRNAIDTDVYILSGRMEELYHPRFSYRGFRYAELSVEGSVEVLEFYVEILRTDTRNAGFFECSDPYLNELHRLSLETEACNHHSILTDCPQRDERMGWLNDLASRLYQTVNNFGVERFLPKVANDIADTANENGSVKDTAPYYLGNEVADPVSVAVLLIGKLCYELYGDRRILEEHYEHYKNWVEFLTGKTEDGLLTLGVYGDWCPAISVEPCVSRRQNRGFPIPLISTMYLYWHYQLMIFIARVLDKSVDEARYAGLAEKTRTLINERFYDREKARYCADVQAGNAVALSLGIAEESEQNKLLQAILTDLEERGWHMTCGNQSYRHLLGALAENGRNDVILRLLKNREYPGWGYMLACGATTVWERWENEVTKQSEDMHSYCHPMFGSYDYWFYQYLGGIRRKEDNAGMSEFLVAPCILKEVPSVTCSIETLSGTIEVFYERKGDIVEYRIKVPSNTVADVLLPGKQPLRLNSGLHTGSFAAPWAAEKCSA